MGSLRTSEEDDVVAGEGRKSDARDENRAVDEGPKIMITPGPGSIAIQTPAPPVQRKTAIPAAPQAQRRGGLGLVIALYGVSAAALAYAIYERYFQ